MKRLIAISLLVSLPLIVRAEQAAPAGESRITFLHLSKVGSRITLDSVTTVAGNLKVPKRLDLHPGDLQVSVETAAGVELYRTGLADPSVRRLEYADSTGTLHTRVDVQDSVHFTLRVPYHSTQHSVNFMRVEEDATGGTSQRVESHLGTIVIPHEERDHD